MVFNKILPLLVRVKETSGCPKASRLTISTIFRVSVLSERKYFSLAGVLKNKSLTEPPIILEELLRDEALEAFKIWYQKEDKVPY